MQFERPAGAATLARLTMFGNDYLRGTNAITVTEAMTIAGQSIIEGTSSHTNTFNIAAGATLHVNQTGGLSFRTLNNHGSIELAGGKCFVMINDAVFDNKPTGTYMVTTGQMGGCLPGATGGRQFNNQGRMVKEGPGQFGFLGRIDVTNTGTLEVNAGTATVAGAFVQKAGETRLRDGSALSRALLYPGDFIFDGGALRGTGTIALHLPNTLRNNGAVVDPIGVLTISDGNYSQAISGTLQFDIGGLIPNTQHDVLNVSGNASLNGSLILSPTHGFRPASGDAFNVMSYGSRNGEFASIEHGLGLAFGRSTRQVVLQSPIVPP